MIKNTHAKKTRLEKPGKEEDFGTFYFYSSQINNELAL